MSQSYYPDNDNDNDEIIILMQETLRGIKMICAAIEKYIKRRAKRLATTKSMTAAYSKARRIAMSKK